MARVHLWCFVAPASMAMYWIDKQNATDCCLTSFALIPVDEFINFIAFVDYQLRMVSHIVRQTYSNSFDLDRSSGKPYQLLIQEVKSST